MYELAKDDVNGCFPSMGFLLIIIDPSKVGISSRNYKLLGLEKLQVVGMSSNRNYNKLQVVGEL